MNEIDLTNYNFSNDRSELRKEIINIFLNEAPGTGKEELTTRYKYVTKQLDNGNDVFLSRPANFNNGFDFTLNVSGTNFNNYIPGKRASTRPTHGNILDDLAAKKDENSALYQELIKQVDLIFDCKAPTNLVFNFNTGHTTELLIECIKWLFVEQDVTYWNYSGRTMFYESIKAI